MNATYNKNRVLMSSPIKFIEGNIDIHLLIFIYAYINIFNNKYRGFTILISK